MEQITISKFIFDSLVETVEDLKQVLNRVNYDSDHNDPRNIESCPAYAVGYSKSSVDSILFNLNTIKETNT